MLDKKTFKNGDMAYRSAPFWSWNDKLQKEELIRQIREMHEQGMGGFFMHPRGGIEDAYLEESHLARVRDCIEEAERLGMKAWIYDEAWCPSGNAGGKVVRSNPAHAAKMLVMTEVPAAQWTDERTALKLFVREQTGGFRDVTGAGAAQLRTRGDTLYVFEALVGDPNGQFGSVPNADMLDKDAVASFIDITFETYKREAAPKFGGVVPGMFTDEPNFNPGGGNNRLPWTSGLEELFLEQKGYDLLPHLPKLYFDEGEDTSKVRFDFWDVLTRRFIQSFSKQMYDWCDANGLMLTGHYWEHGFPSPMHTGSAMPNYEYMHAPGIDMLFNTEEELDQFGNDLIVKEASSAASQFGRKRVMSETFGASGWDLNFLDMKRVADWQFALGINLVVQHLVHYSLRGYRKRDFPLSFLDHQPWWKAYRLLGDYIGRLSWALAQGSYTGEVLVLHPSSSTWPAFRPGDEGGEALVTLGLSMRTLCKTLGSIQCQYEIGDDLLIERHGRVEDGRFKVGQKAYRVVVMPDMTVMRRSSFELLRRFAEAGGTIVATGVTPHLLDGSPSEELRAFFSDGRIIRVQADRIGLRTALDRAGVVEVRLETRDGREPASIYAHQRSEGDRDTLFLCNISKTDGHATRLRLTEPWPVEAWDALTGETSQVVPYADMGAFYVDLEFPPVGSHLLVIDRSRVDTPAVGPAPRPQTVAAVELTDWRAKRTASNAWTLNRASVALHGGQWEEERNVVGADDNLKDRLGMPRGDIFHTQPWMFTAEEKSRTHRLQAKYVFEVKELPEGELLVAAETVGVFDLLVNGVKIEPTERFYLDRSFVLYDVKHAASAGRNEIVLSTERYGVTVNLESVYIVGDFTLEGDGGRFAIARERRELPLGDLTRTGYPFYTGTVIYETQAEIGNVPDEKVALELGKWHGVAVRVTVNGREAGVIGWAPYEIDITDLLHAGRNDIVVEVMNSLQNVLGPHDYQRIEGLVHPGSFYSPNTIKFNATGYEGGGRLLMKGG